MKAIVIGSGAVGLCTAYYLQKEGIEVSILTSEKKGSVEGCSHGNAGMIVPSHFTPLAAPGVIMDGIKWMFDPKSPFRIKPRLDSDLFSWLYSFVRSANKKNVDRSSSTLLQMNQRSRDLFKKIELENAIDFSYKQGGLMMMYKTARYQDEEEHLAEKARSLGLDVSILNANQMKEHEHILEADVLGGVWYKSDAHLIPENFMEEMHSYLLKNGVHIENECFVNDFEIENNEVRSLKTTKGNFEADEYIVCAGSWSQEIAKRLKDSIKLQGGKGYHLHIEKTPLQLQTPSILCEARIAMTPMGEALRVSGTMEIAGLNLSIENSRVEGIKEKVPSYFNSFDPTWFKGLKPWAGLRPVSPDGLPYIGRSNYYSNLSYNTGHSMMGLSLAPISGVILKDAILGNDSDLNQEIMSPSRFS